MCLCSPCCPSPHFSLAPFILPVHMCPPCTCAHPSLICAAIHTAILCHLHCHSCCCLMLCALPFAAIHAALALVCVCPPCVYALPLMAFICAPLGLFACIKYMVSTQIIQLNSPWYHGLLTYCSLVLKSYYLHCFWSKMRVGVRGENRLGRSKGLHTADWAIFGSVTEWHMNLLKKHWKIQVINNNKNKNKQILMFWVCMLHC